jgi:predicted GNAT family N-acyltransferase
MSSIVGEDNTSRSQDERTIYTAGELVSRELSELKTLRNEIFEKEVKSLLAEVKEKIIEDPNFEISDDSDLAKTLRLIREIDRLTGMSANRLEGSPASLSTPNSSDRSRVELRGD